MCLQIFVKFILIYISTDVAILAPNAFGSIASHGKVACPGWMAESNSNAGKAPAPGTGACRRARGRDAPTVGTFHECGVRRGRRRANPGARPFAFLSRVLRHQQSSPSSNPRHVRRCWSPLPPCLRLSCWQLCCECLFSLGGSPPPRLHSRTASHPDASAHNASTR
jgi:hypothetical protein